MTNINMKQDKDNLLIEIDLTKEFGLTKTGKSTVVAKSDGFLQFASESEIYTLTLFLAKKPQPASLKSSG